MTASVDLSVGQMLGRYELLVAIAQGGMGTVWAARSHGGPAGDRLVAVKTMLPSLSSDEHCKRMFLTESRIASRIKHPNVCAILDQGEQSGVLYFVMEWIDGDSLIALIGGSSRQQATPVPFQVAVRIGIEAARGLHAAHELRAEDGALLGLVHRDVSPHNILVTREGLVKIADFGVAKAVAMVDNPTTNTGHMKGKLYFMAPEQVHNEEIDRRTDVFALGIVLYQLTTGRHPFAAGHDLATMARITRPAPVDAPSTLVPDYPPALEAAVMRALAKRPDQRFATMAELAAALKAVAVELGEQRSEVAAYIRDALAARTEQRAAMIKDALRASRGGTTTRPMPRGDHGRQGRAIATAAALMAAGALLAGAFLLWIDTGEPRGGAPTLNLPTTTTLEQRLTVATPRTLAPTPSLSASPAPQASTAATTSATVPPTPVHPAADSGRARFRDPGF